MGHSSILQKVDNAAFVCGDAADVLARRIPSQSISELFINYPQPPAFYDAHLHFLTETLFRDIYRALESGGTMTIVSDNEDYLRVVSSELDKLRNKFFTNPLVVKGIPSEYPSSYFDRLWTNAENTLRYHIHVRRLR